MLYETSKLHPETGITYRGMDLFELRDKGAKTVPGGQPNPEGAVRACWSTLCWRCQELQRRLGLCNLLKVYGQRFAGPEAAPSLWLHGISWKPSLSDLLVAFKDYIELHRII